MIYSSTPLITDQRDTASTVLTNPAVLNKSKKVNELSFDSNNKINSGTPKSAGKQGQLSRELVLVSTPKYDTSVAQKEELAIEFKNMNLSVKKTIKHFENLSTSITQVPQYANNDNDDDDDSFSQPDENGLSVKLFRDLVQSKTKQLLSLSDAWIVTCTEQSDLIPDRIQGDIRCVCGLAKLLMEERFKQFTELIDLCVKTLKNTLDEGVKEVHCSDLQGFWEMINHQVKDVEGQFAKLEKIKQKNYSEEFADETDHVVRVKKTAVRKAAAKSSNDPSAKATASTATAKSKFSEFRAQMKKAKASSSIDTPTENETENLPATMNLPNQVFTSVESLAEPSAQTQTPGLDKTQDMDALIEMKESASQKSKNKKRSVIKSRPSDLIKFDSPVPLKKNNNFSQAIAEHAEEEDADDDVDLAADDKENDPFDFEPFVPLVWSNSKTPNSKPTVPKSPMSVHNMTPKTPSRATPSERRTQSQFNELVNSPLLKLAMVSSHGKSRSSKKNFN